MRKPEAALSVLLLLALVSVSGCGTSSAQEESALSDLLSANPPQKTYDPPPEGGYTWQQLLNLTLEDDPDCAAIMAEARAEYYRYKSRTDLEDLSLSAGYSYIPEVPSNEYSAELRFSIPNPFVNKHVIRAGEASRRQIETNAEMLKNEIASRIYELIQEIVIGERELSVLLSREQYMSDWYDVLKARFDVRMATQAEISGFDIQSMKLKAAVRQKRFETEAARRSLQILVPIPGEKILLNPVPTDWKALLALLEDEQALIENACSRSAELAGAIAEYEKASAILGIANAKQIPWFNSVDLAYSRDLIQSGTSDTVNNNWSLQLRINLPVFAWFSSEKKMAAAEMEAAAFQITGIRTRIQSKITKIVPNLRETIQFLIDYQSAYDAMPEINSEIYPNIEAYYRMLDSRLSAFEFALNLEMDCAQLYSKLLEITGIWE